MLNRIQPEIEKILTNNLDGFGRNCSATSQLLIICRIIEGVHAKHLMATLLFVNTHREQILLVYGLSKESVIAILMLYKNTKGTVLSPDDDTDVFDIVVGVMQADILTTYSFIINIDYILRTSISLIRKNSFTQKKKADNILKKF